LKLFQKKLKVGLPRCLSISSLAPPRRAKGFRERSYVDKKYVLPLLLILISSLGSVD
jgi:hypothetical protein